MLLSATLLIVRILVLQELLLERLERYTPSPKVFFENYFETAHSTCRFTRHMKQCISAEGSDLSSENSFGLFSCTVTIKFVYFHEQLLPALQSRRQILRLYLRSAVW